MSDQDTVNERNRSMDVHYQTTTYLFYQTEFQITVFERMRVVRVTGKNTIDEQGF